MNHDAVIMKRYSYAKTGDPILERSKNEFRSRYDFHPHFKTPFCFLSRSKEQFERKAL